MTQLVQPQAAAAPGCACSQEQALFAAIHSSTMTAAAAATMYFVGGTFLPWKTLMIVLRRCGNDTAASACVLEEMSLENIWAGHGLGLEFGRVSPVGSSVGNN